MYRPAATVHVQARQILELRDLSTKCSEERACERNCKHATRLEDPQAAKRASGRSISTLALATARDDPEGHTDDSRLATGARRQPLECTAVRELRGTQDLARRVHGGRRHAVRLEQGLGVLLGEAAGPRRDVFVDLIGRFDARVHRREAFGPRRRTHCGDYAVPLVILHRRDSNVAVAALVEAGGRAVTLRAADAAGVQQDTADLEHRSRSRP